jgi:hypothetical protein
MDRRKLLGEKVGYHADVAWERPDPCWGECSYCWNGAHRFEDEAVAELALALLRPRPA